VAVWERTALISIGALAVSTAVIAVISPWARRNVRSINLNIILLLGLSAVPIAGAVLFDARLTDVIWFLRETRPMASKSFLSSW